MYALKGHFQMIEACGTLVYSVYVIALGLSLPSSACQFTEYIPWGFFFSVTVKFLFRCSGSAAKQNPRR